MACPLPTPNTTLTYSVTNLFQQQYKPLHRLFFDTGRMEVSALYTSLIMSLIVCNLNSRFTTNVPGTPLTQQGGPEEDRATPLVMDGFSLKCKLQVSAHEPAFLMDGDYVVGGIFSIHHYREEMKREYTTSPESSRCTGRSVKGRHRYNATYCCSIQSVLKYVFIVRHWNFRNSRYLYILVKRILIFSRVEFTLL